MISAFLCGRHLSIQFICEEKLKRLVKTTFSLICLKDSFMRYNILSILSQLWVIQRVILWQTTLLIKKKKKKIISLFKYFCYKNNPSIFINATFIWGCIYKFASCRKSIPAKFFFTISRYGEKITKIKVFQNFHAIFSNLTSILHHTTPSLTQHGT